MKKILLIVSLLLSFAFNAFASIVKDATYFDPLPVSIQAATDLPIGTILIWSESGTLPDGYLECNGQAVNSSLFPKLRALMTHTPNFQGMFLRGYGSQAHSQNNGTTIGITSTTHASGNLGAIQGDAARKIWGTMGNSVATGSARYSGALKIYPLGGDSTESGGSDTGFELDSSFITPTATENRPANIAVRYIIKAK